MRREILDQFAQEVISKNKIQILEKNSIEEGSDFKMMLLIWDWENVMLCCHIKS